MLLTLMVLKKCLENNKSIKTIYMKYLIILSCFFITTATFSQNFTTDIATAKTSYASGKLEDAHFALQQAMQEIDIIIGKQVITLLPNQMEQFTANTKDDNVIAMSVLLAAPFIAVRAKR